MDSREVGELRLWLDVPTERAIWSIDLAVADLILAVLQCKTTDDALKLREFVEPLILKLQAVESAALHKADQLSGASRG